HLVRDPRDVAAAWRTEKRFPDTGMVMPMFSPLHTAFSWTGRNLAAEWATRKIGQRMLRVRYEDFTTAPQATVDRILRHAGFTGTASNLIGSDSTVVLEPGHTIMGNPSRFDHGQIRIAARTTEPVASRTFDIVTYPLRRRYGYTG
ncbi:MAG: sulfotransferase, partial [Acidimicrobiia bacterium]